MLQSLKRAFLEVGGLFTQSLEPHITLTRDDLLTFIQKPKNRMCGKFAAENNLEIAETITAAASTISHFYPQHSLAKNVLQLAEILETTDDLTGSINVPTRVLMDILDNREILHMIYENVDTEENFKKAKLVLPLIYGINHLGRKFEYKEFRPNNPLVRFKLDLLKLPEIPSEQSVLDYFKKNNLIILDTIARKPTDLRV